jgi:cell division protein FtsB
MKRWILIGIGAGVIGSFVFSNNLKLVFSRQRSIEKLEKELNRLSQETVLLQEKINELQTNPSHYETLVRKELGYLRPGEKEVRFINN